MDVKKSTKSPRNYGIDLLRIVSMLMIVMLHLSGMGGIANNSASFLNTGIIWVSKAATYCAVNCYALISGYVGVRSKQRLSSLGELWLRVAFYSVTITIFFYFTRPDIVSFGKILHACFPVTNTQYWYFTAYFGMWFFTPIASAAVNNISKRKMGLLLVGTALILTPSNLMGDAFTLEGGYTTAWLFYLYLLGAFLGKYDMFKNVSTIKLLLGYVLSIGVTTVLKLALASDGYNFWGDMMFNYTSPTMLIAAVSLLGFFCNLNVPSWSSKLISFFAPLSFSVYLIHTHPLVFNHVFKHAFVFLGEKSPVVLILGMIGFTLAIYLGCVLIDYVRHLAFKLCRVKQLLSLAENKFWAVFDKYTSKSV